MTKTAKIRVHFENDPGLDSIFDVSQERIRQALKRNKEAALRIDLSFGHGEPGFEKRVTDADVLFAWRFPHLQIGASQITTHRIGCRRTRRMSARTSSIGQT